LLTVEEDFFDPVYKGCTSPSTAFGISLLPFIAGTFVFAQTALVGFVIFGIPALVFVMICYGFLFMWAKKVSRNDDQRLNQLLLRLRIRFSQIPSRRIWGAVSFSPLPPRR
jgi:type IV secretion system protein VirB3